MVFYLLTSMKRFISHTLYPALSALLLMLMVTFQLPSAQADIQIIGLDDMVVNGWDGNTLDVVAFDDYCVTSVNDNGGSVNYDVAMQGNSDGGGNFFLIHDGNAPPLPVNVTWTHLDTNAVFNMTDYTKTGFLTNPVPGGVTCAGINATVRIRIIIPQASLAIAEAGTYTGAYQVDALQLGTPNQYTGLQDFSITLPELVQITQLEDINVTVSNGDRARVSRNFCIFRNRPGGVSLTINGLNDDGNQLNLLGPNSTTIPYRIQFRQQGVPGGWTTVTAGATLDSANSGFTGNTTRDCGGNTNTSIRFIATRGNIQGKPAGAYTDTLSIRVEPD